MFGTIKMYMIAAVGVVISIAAFIFRARGDKIEELEAKAEVADKEKAVTARVVENEKKAAAFIADNRVAKVEAENEEDTTKYDPNTKFYI